MSRVQGRDVDPLFTGPFLLLWVSGLFLQMSFGLMVHLPGYLTELGATESVIGLIYSAGALVALLLRPVMGRIIDGFGRKRVVLVAGMLVIIASASYIPLVEIGLPVFAVRIFYAVSEVTMFTTLLALGADLSPESRRVQGLALFGIAGLIPIGVGSISGDIVSAAGSYERVFVLAAGLALVGWVLAWWLPDLPPARASGTRHPGFLRVAFQRNLLPVWLLAAGMVVGAESLFIFMRTYVDASGRGSVGMYFGIYATVAIVVRIFVRGGSDQRSLVLMVVPAMSCVAAQHALLGLTDSLGAMAVAGALGGIGHALLFPVLTTMVVNRAAASERGTALAVFSGLFDTAVLLAAPVVGRAIESFGYDPTFEMISVVVLSCMVGFLVWDRRVSAPESAVVGA